MVAALIFPGGLASANSRAAAVALLAANSTLTINQTAEHTPAKPPPPGRKLGRYRVTYYWVAAESESEPRTRVLRDQQCKPIARVARSFAKRVRLEGTGRLADGRVVNVAGHCKCGKRCFTVPLGADWGLGVQNRKLRPFRSVAVDPRKIRIGRRLYIPELDGVPMPGTAPWGGFVHDGCVVAEDVGGGIRGKQIDFFVGLRAHYPALAARHAGRRMTVRDGRKRCDPRHRFQRFVNVAGAPPNPG